MKKFLVMLLVVSIMFTLTSFSTFAAKGGNGGGNSEVKNSEKSLKANQDNTTSKKSEIGREMEKIDRANGNPTIVNTLNKKNVKEKMTKEQKKQNIKEIVAQKRAQNDHATPVIVNGKGVTFDVPPVIKYGRTLIPVRAITNSLGGIIQWNSETKTVTITKGEITIIIALGSNIATVNGKETTLDVPAQLVSNRTMVPIRFIAIMFKQQVEWDEETGAVVIDDVDETPTTTPEPTSTPVPSDVPVPSATPGPTVEPADATPALTEEPIATATPAPTEPEATVTPAPTEPEVTATPAPSEPVATETPVEAEITPSPTP